MTSIKARTFTKEELKKFYFHSVSDSKPQLCLHKTEPASLRLAQQSALPGRFTPNLVALRSITTTCHMQLSPGKAFLYGPLSPVLPFLLRKTALLSLHLDGKREAISQTFILLTFPFSAPAAAKSTEVSPSSSCSGKVILQTPKFYFSLPYLTQIGL